MEFPYTSRVEDTNATFSDDELQMDALTANPPSRQPYESSNHNLSVDNESDNLPRFQAHEDRPWMNSSGPEEKYDNAQKEPQENSFFSNFNFESQSEQGSAASPTHSYIDDEAELKEKRLMLFKLKRYEKRNGIKPDKPLSIHSPLEEIRTELHALKKEVQMDKTVDNMKKGLMLIISSIETLNHKYDPLDLYLDGWSAQVDEDLDTYDDVLERIYDLYSDNLEMHPLLELAMMLAMSAMTCHKMRNGGMKILQPPRPPSVREQLQPPSGDLAQQLLQEDLHAVNLPQR